MFKKWKTAGVKTDVPPHHRVGPFLLSLFSPYRYYFLILTVCILLWAIGMSLKPYILKGILDRLAEHQGISLWILCYIGLLFFDVFNNRSYDYISLKLLPVLKSDIFQKMTDYVMGHSHAYFQGHPPGSLSNKMNDVAHGVAELVTIVLDRFLSNILAFIMAIFAFCSVSVVLGIILLTWMLLYLSVTIYCATRIHAHSFAVSELNSHLLGRIVDILVNNMVVRFFSAQVYEHRQIQKLLEKYRQQDRAMQTTMMKLYLFQGLSFVVMLSVCLLYLMIAHEKNWVTVGDFALVLTLSLSIVECMWGISEDFSQFSEHVGKVAQGLSVVFEPHDIQDKAGAKTLTVQTGTIVFHEVDFHYKHPKALFENLNLTIPGGQKVGLVGLSGSGKTTFVHLILRLYSLSAGSICIDGHNIAGLTQNSLRDQIGVIPQEGMLFNRSIIENIRYGRLESTFEEVVEAAKKAHAHDFIMLLDEGYDTMVGERGLKLSGGQKQRLVIARALLKNAPILVLDEATSALDTITEQDIQDGLNILMHQKTCIIIAHRLSTLQHVDRILVFDQGRIVEDGTHEELLKNNGTYARLWNSQRGGFIG